MTARENDRAREAQDVAITTLRAEVERLTSAWRCYHCDEVFTDSASAAEHFGCILDEPACKLNKTEVGILGLLRDAQRQLEEYRNESDPQSRAFYALGSQHSIALREAEQEGYDKGLADGRADRDAAIARAEKAEAVLAERDKHICASKASFEAYIRELRRENIGEDADDLTEANFILDFAEPAWPDFCRWSEIWGYLNAGGELTSQQRIKALAYEDAGEEYPTDAMRLDPCANEDCPLRVLASLTEGE